jgi:hypothetical protein
VVSLPIRTPLLDLERFDFVVCNAAFWQFSDALEILQKNRPREWRKIPALNQVLIRYQESPQKVFEEIRREFDKSQQDPDNNAS